MTRDRIGDRGLLITLCVAELVCSLEGTMITLAISELYRIYGDPVRVGWVLTAFGIAAGSSAAISGRLGDLYGRRRVLLVLLFLAGLGSLIGASFEDLRLIILGRLLQGVSMGILPLCYGLVKEHVEFSRGVHFIGVLGGVYSFGIAAGLIMGGLILDYGHWQQIFLVSAGWATIAFLLVLILLPRGARQHKQGTRIDYLGAVLSAPAIALMLLSMTEASRTGFASAAPWLWLAAAISLISIWVLHELRCEDPLIDLRQLKKRSIAAANACGLLIAAGPLLFSLVLLPLLLQPKWTGVGLGLAATVAALLKIPANIGGGVAAMFAGKAATALGPRRVVVGACFITAAAYALLAFSHSSPALIALVMVLFLAAPVCLISAILPMFVLAAAQERASEAAGLHQVCRSIGNALGTQAIAIMLSSASVQNSLSGIRYPAESAFVLVFVYLSCLGIAAGLSILAAPRHALGMSKEVD
ncbi:MAG: MFS transporter [Novosphingobium sp.]|nr:MFS transporter [Novosphingobium sp.]